VRVTWTIAGVALAAAACSTNKQPDATAEGNSAAAVPATSTTTTTTPAAGGGAATSDADRATDGAGVPSGYVGRTDREGVAISGAKYAAAKDGKWEITTGPAHIVYAAKDSARGSYTASATFEQLEAPAHPEAYGIFIGGRNLDQPTQQYTYFVVRGGGEYLIKVRDGAGTRTVSDWKASDAVPKADAAGKATYRVAAQVGADSVRFLVNDKAVTSVAKASVPTDGIAGVRVNHNLHVLVTPLTVKK